MKNLRFAPLLLALTAWGCFQAVPEEECDDARPCGSGWLCVKGVCTAPGNTGGGSATGGGVATGGGTATGGGVATGGGTAAGGGTAVGGGSSVGGGSTTGGGGGINPVGGGGGQTGGGGGGSGCPGCLDSTGQCEPGVTNAACGANGGACVACSGATACFNGQCTMPQCLNCSGCCIAGICLGGTSSMACGSGGAQCVDCSQGGGFCQGGMCSGGSGGGGGTTCGPNNCMGCCDNMGTCRAGITHNRCGFGGNACMQCGMGEQCQMGICSGGVVDAGMGLPVGSACMNQLDCQPPQTNICIAELSAQFGQSGFPGGYCSALCANVMCPMGSSCIGHEFIGPNGGGVSLQLCLSQCSAPRMGQSTCRMGYVCEKDTSGSAAGVCTPNCNSAGASCPAGTACDPGSGYCN